jgi:hypothetical protein
MHSTLRVIINGIYTLENFDSAMLAKYMRCLFQVTLPLDTALALSLVDETLRIIKECRQVRSTT